MAGTACFTRPSEDTVVHTQDSLGYSSFFPGNRKVLEDYNLVVAYSPRCYSKYKTSQEKVLSDGLKEHAVQISPSDEEEEFSTTQSKIRRYFTKSDSLCVESCIFDMHTGELIGLGLINRNGEYQVVSLYDLEQYSSRIEKLPYKIPQPNSASVRSIEATSVVLVEHNSKGAGGLIDLNGVLRTDLSLDALHFVLEHGSFNGLTDNANALWSYIVKAIPSLSSIPVSFHAKACLFDDTRKELFGRRISGYDMSLTIDEFPLVGLEPVSCTPADRCDFSYAYSAIANYCKGTVDSEKLKGFASDLNFAIYNKGLPEIDLNRADIDVQTLGLLEGILRPVIPLIRYKNQQSSSADEYDTIVGLYDVPYVQLQVCNNAVTSVDVYYTTGLIKRYADLAYILLELAYMLGGIDNFDDAPEQILGFNFTEDNADIPLKYSVVRSIQLHAFCEMCGHEMLPPKLARQRFEMCNNVAQYIPNTDYTCPECGNKISYKGIHGTYRDRYGEDNEWTRD